MFHFIIHIYGAGGFSLEAYIYCKIFLSGGAILQLESLSVPFISVEDLPLDLSEDFDVVVDAMFGFSFHGNYYLSSYPVNLSFSRLYSQRTLIQVLLFSLNCCPCV